MNAYIIVSAKHYFDLPILVNNNVANGYRPVGSPFVNLDGTLSQAMYKEPKSKSKGE